MPQPWSSSLRGGPSKKDAHAKAPTTREAYKQLLSLTVYESGSDGPNPRSPGEGYVNNHSPRQPTPADHAEAAAPSGGKRKVRKKKMTVFDRLTDVRSYTGTHRERFDESGHGRGLVGRERWELDMDSRCLSFHAIRDIAAGEELLMDYNQMRRPKILCPT